MINHIHKNFEIVEFSEENIQDELSMAIEYFTYIPEDYLRWILAIGGDILLKFGEHSYLNIWTPLECMTVTKNYETYIRQHIPNAFPFAGNFVSEFLAYVHNFEPNGIYKFSFGNICAEDGQFIALNLHQILIEAIGLDVIAH
jgi:hypothetical protein